MTGKVIANPVGKKNHMQMIDVASGSAFFWSNSLRHMCDDSDLPELTYLQVTCSGVG